MQRNMFCSLTILFTYANSQGKASSPPHMYEGDMPSFNLKGHPIPSYVLCISSVFKIPAIAHT